MSWTRNTTGGGRGRLVASTAAAVLTLGGIGTLAAGCGSPAPPPPKPAHPSSSANAPQGVPGPSKQAAPKQQKPDTLTLPASKPTAISIPAINVQSSLLTMGQTPDGAIEVPQMGPNYDKAGWYKFSPTPGEIGPAVILGHIDSAKKGPSVFFHLDSMKPGEKASVTRADGTVAVFTVDRVKQYPKSNFPTLKVYGNTDSAQLRLITCGGDFNKAKRSYVDDTVVYAHLTSSHPA
jgi:LPXTG-site transpeptidase (sortase) family protein